MGRRSPFDMGMIRMKWVSLKREKGVEIEFLLPCNGQLEGSLLADSRRERFESGSFYLGEEV